MGAVREAWTDERLDDLNTRVGDGFREMRADNRTLLEITIGLFSTSIVGFAVTIATVLLRT
jgi:hypothetical protein